uniref:Uncharacterized protein n=1 Tax=Paramormyrops kingsleyae TaxID=1676925 RepID=A0A3B3RBE1_9TELE
CTSPGLHADNLKPPPSSQLHLQQLLVHVVLHQVGTKSALTPSQVISSDPEGRFAGIQPGRGCRLVNVLLQLRLPEVDVLQPVAEVPRPVRLAAQRDRLRLHLRFFGLMPHLLRLVAIICRLEKQRVVVLGPLLRGVLGAPIPRSRKAGGRVKFIYDFTLLRLRS